MSAAGPINGASRANSPESIAKRFKAIAIELDALRKSVVDAAEPVPTQETSAEWLRAILLARRRRAAIFGTGMFADPAWDILLELFACKLDGVQTSVAELSRQTAIPGTTVLRWVAELERAGFAVRHASGQNRRRVWIEMSPKGEAAMVTYFSENVPRSAGL